FQIMDKLKLLILMAGIFISISGVKAQSDEVTEMKWPREVTTKNGVLTYYQPQIDSYKDNIIEGRCAISMQPENGDMLFGAFWFHFVFGHFCKPIRPPELPCWIK